MSLGEVYVEKSLAIVAAAVCVVVGVDDGYGLSPGLGPRTRIRNGHVMMMVVGGRLKLAEAVEIVVEQNRKAFSFVPSPVPEDRPWGEN